MENHYEEHIGKSFYEPMIDYMTSGIVVPMVWEGLNAVQISRRMIGHYNPTISMPGQIRSDFSMDSDRNVVHGSDSLAAASKEIPLWFQEKELMSWTPNNLEWIYL